jgi:hypothetical protein
VRVGAEPLAAAIAVASTLFGLTALWSQLVSGMALAGLLALWSLQLGGLPSPLARLCPLAATQDLLAPEPAGSQGRRSPVLLLVRTDFGEPAAGPVAAVCSRAGELTWAIIAITLGAVAARALDAPGGAIGVIQAVPALGSLALLAAVLLPKRRTHIEVTYNWTGLETALELIGSDAGAASLSFDLVAVGATELGGAARALRADPNATTAWRCWEFSSADRLRAAIATNH